MEVDLDGTDSDVTKLGLVHPYVCVGFQLEGGIAVARDPLFDTSLHRCEPRDSRAPSKLMGVPVSPVNSGEALDYLR